MLNERSSRDQPKPPPGREVSPLYSLDLPQADPTFFGSQCSFRLKHGIFMCIAGGHDGLRAMCGPRLRNPCAQIDLAWAPTPQPRVSFELVPTTVSTTSHPSLSTSSRWVTSAGLLAATFTCLSLTHFLMGKGWDVRKHEEGILEWLDKASIPGARTVPRGGKLCMPFKNGCAKTCLHKPLERYSGRLTKRHTLQII